MESTDPLLPLVRRYFEDSPLTAAHTLETLPEETAATILKELPLGLTSQAFAHFPPGFAARTLKVLPPSVFRELVSNLEPERGAAIFLDLPHELRARFLENLPDKTKRQMQEILKYPEDSAGRTMSTDTVSLHTSFKVRDAIEKIRTLARVKSPFYVYTVDDKNHLVGVINMRDLMLAPDDALLESVMRKDVFCVNAFSERSQVVHEMADRKYFAAPVVDQQNRLLGVVKADELLADAQEQATEDLQKMFGAGGDERAFSPILFSLAKRVPWLYVNLCTAFLAAFVVSLFQGMISRITVLAVFLPVVAGQGGNTGAQSLAVVMRGLVMREFPRQRAFQLIFKEAFLGLVSGVLIGSVTALGAWLWMGIPFLGVVIGLAMIVELCVAALSGAAIPITMKAIGLDPAQCSNIILTTITDVVGISSFLGFATLFQKFLV